MKRAQSILEYAVLVACFIAAVIGMQIYVKRGIQGRLRAAADDLGQQYAPKNTDSTMTLNVKSDTFTEVNTKEIEPTTGKKYYESTTNTTINETQTQSGSETAGEPEPSLF